MGVPILQEREGKKEHVPPPATDEDALRLLDDQDARLTQLLRNLYGTYRQQGHTVLNAYAKTLEAFIASHEAGSSDTQEHQR